MSKQIENLVELEEVMVANDDAITEVCSGNNLGKGALIGVGLTAAGVLGYKLAKKAVAKIKEKREGIEVEVCEGVIEAEAEVLEETEDKSKSKKKKEEK